MCEVRVDKMSRSKNSEVVTDVQHENRGRMSKRGRGERHRYDVVCYVCGQSITGFLTQMSESVGSREV